MFGLWPKIENTSQKKLKCNLYMLFILLMFLIVDILPCILSSLRMQNFILKIEIWQFILPVVTCLIRLIIFWWKKEGMYDNVCTDY